MSGIKRIKSTNMNVKAAPEVKADSSGYDRGQQLASALEGLMGSVNQFAVTGSKLYAKSANEKAKEDLMQDLVAASKTEGGVEQWFKDHADYVEPPKGWSKRKWNAFNTEKGIRSLGLLKNDLESSKQNYIQDLINNPYDKKGNKRTFNQSELDVIYQNKYDFYLKNSNSNPYFLKEYMESGLKAVSLRTQKDRIANAETVHDTWRTEAEEASVGRASLPSFNTYIELTEGSETVEIENDDGTITTESRLKQNFNIDEFWTNKAAELSEIYGFEVMPEDAKALSWAQYIMADINATNQHLKDVDGEPFSASQIASKITGGLKEQIESYILTGDADSANLLLKVMQNLLNQESNGIALKDSSNSETLISDYNEAWKIVNGENDDVNRQAQAVELANFKTDINANGEFFSDLLNDELTKTVTNEAGEEVEIPIGNNETIIRQQIETLRQYNLKKANDYQYKHVQATLEGDSDLATVYKDMENYYRSIAEMNFVKVDDPSILDGTHPYMNGRSLEEWITEGDFAGNSTSILRLSGFITPETYNNLMENPSKVQEAYVQIKRRINLAFGFPDSDDMVQEIVNKISGTERVRQWNQAKKLINNIPTEWLFDITKNANADIITVLAEKIKPNANQENSYVSDGYKAIRSYLDQEGKFEVKYDSEGDLTIENLELTPEQVPAEDFVSFIANAAADFSKDGEREGLIKAYLLYEKYPDTYNPVIEKLQKEDPTLYRVWQDVLEQYEKTRKVVTWQPVAEQYWQNVVLDTEGTD